MPQISLLCIPIWRLAFKYGQAITGLDDVNEMSRLSGEYKDHAYYFATRASEIHFKLTDEAAEADISDEITVDTRVK